MAKLVIKRRIEFMSFLRPIKLSLDGKTILELKVGGQKVVQLERGIHELVISQDFLFRKIDIKVNDDSDEVWINLGYKWYFNLSGVLLLISFLTVKAMNLPMKFLFIPFALILVILILAFAFRKSAFDCKVK